LRGGDRGRAATGRRTTTRPVKSVGEDLRLNRALWTLTERLAGLPQATGVSARFRISIFVPGEIPAP